MGLGGDDIDVRSVPLLIANGFGFFFVRGKRKTVRFLFFIPSVVCLVIVYHYWTLAMAMG